MVAPQTPKKVGIGGCLVSVLLFILSIVAFFGLIVWATVGIVNSLQAAPSVPLGSSGTVNISSTGTQYVFLGDLDSNGRIPVSNPDITITDPSGKAVTVTAPTATTSSSSGNAAFRQVGEFNATTTGAYTVEVGSAVGSFPNAKVYVASFDITNLGAKIGLAFLIGGVLFVASLVVGIIWLVRRSRAKKVLPPHQGGYPPPGGYPPAGGYPAQPSSPQPGGWPQNPPPGPGGYPQS